MIKSVPKLLAAAGLSLSLALSGVMVSVTPAQADNENLRRFIGGVAAIALLGTIIENQRDRRTYTTVAPHGVPRHVPHGVVQQPRHVPHQLIAPSRCYNSYQGPHGVFRGFGAGCMQSSAYYSQLPSACLERVFTHRGWRNVYDAQCLYNRGWVRS